MPPRESKSHAGASSRPARRVAGTQRARRGPGRPARTDDPQRVAVLLPGELKKKLRIRAFEEGRDMGDLVSDALRDYLRRR